MTEQKARLLARLLDELTGGDPEIITLEEFKVTAHSVGLTDMYDSTVGFVRRHLQDATAGGPGASPYGFKRRDVRDIVEALRAGADFRGELVCPGGKTLPFAKGYAILKHANGDRGVISPADLSSTYRLAEGFRRKGKPTRRGAKQSGADSKRRESIRATARCRCLKWIMSRHAGHSPKTA